MYIQKESNEEDVPHHCDAPRAPLDVELRELSPKRSNSRMRSGGRCPNSLESNRQWDKENKARGVRSSGVACYLSACSRNSRSRSSSMMLRLNSSSFFCSSLSSLSTAFCRSYIINGRVKQVLESRTHKTKNTTQRKDVPLDVVSKVTYHICSSFFQQALYFFLVFLSLEPCLLCIHLFQLFVICSCQKPKQQRIDNQHESCQVRGTQNSTW